MARRRTEAIEIVDDEGSLPRRAAAATRDRVGARAAEASGAVRMRMRSGSDGAGPVEMRDPSGARGRCLLAGEEESVQRLRDPAGRQS